MGVKALEVKQLSAAIAVAQRYAKGWTVEKKSAGKDQVLPAVRAILGDQGGHMALPAIHERLQGLGIHVGGADPVQNLATLLSRNKGEFGLMVERGKGWTLAQANGTAHGTSTVSAVSAADDAEL